MMMMMMMMMIAVVVKMMTLLRISSRSMQSLLGHLLSSSVQDVKYSAKQKAKGSWIAPESDSENGRSFKNGVLHLGFLCCSVVQGTCSSFGR